jgi:two-component system chemotaxis response regulator CheY
MNDAKVLVIEDDRAILQAVSEILESDGFGVARAENGKVALGVLDRDPEFSLILLDVMMPVMDGAEFQKLKLNDPRLSSIPVLLITGDSQARKRAKQLGADGVLQKPFLGDDLLREVRRTLETHPRVLH